MIPARAAEPQAVRVSTTATTRLDGDPVLVIGPDEAMAGPADGALLGPSTRGRDGVTVREVVVDGWWFAIEVELERRADLRGRASRGRAGAGTSGPTELRAVIPGRIVALSVTAGDVVEAGQQVLVVEAMKMHNELRAPRSGTIERVVPGVGENVDVGDLLLVIT
jgi:3-methylcrotonyl-CoA carboxylase alpha subunit